jgi:hypothetical protein
LRAAAGVARGLHRFGQDQEQKPHHVSDGGVVVGGNLPRLAVEFWFDGYGDISDGSHGLVLRRFSGISFYLECAPEAENYRQSACRKNRGLPILKNEIWVQILKVHGDSSGLMSGSPAKS